MQKYKVDYYAHEISLKNMTAINDIFDENILEVLRFDKRGLWGDSRGCFYNRGDATYNQYLNSQSLNDPQREIHRNYITASDVSAIQGKRCTELVERFNNEPIEVLRRFSQHNNGIKFTRIDIALDDNEEKKKLLFHFSNRKQLKRDVCSSSREDL